ncbi:unnamed protein product [Absidia cylindrospora]
MDKKWIKESLMKTAELFLRNDVLDINDYSESDLLHNIWSFVYRAFIGKGDVLPVDDKYLNDGLMKLPKTLKDMLVVLVEKNPCKVNQLSSIGYLMMGLGMELIIMDCPVGNSITRVTMTKSLDFPISVSSITSDLLPLLELVS